VMPCVVKIIIQFAKEIKLIKIFARLFVKAVQEKKFILVKTNPISLKENLKQLNNAVVLLIINQFVEMMEDYTITIVIWLAMDVLPIVNKEYVEGDFQEDLFPKILILEVSVMVNLSLDIKDFLLKIQTL